MATVGEATKNVAMLVKEIMNSQGFTFTEAWTIVEDQMDRQQHFQDNQVTLMVNGFSDMVIKEDDGLVVEESNNDDDDENPIVDLKAIN